MYSSHVAHRGMLQVYIYPAAANQCWVIASGLIEHLIVSGHDSEVTALMRHGESLHELRPSHGRVPKQATKHGNRIEKKNVCQ